MHGTCRKCRAEDVAMYQERIWSHLKKMLQHIRNIWQVTVRRGDNVSGRSCNLRTSRKMLKRIRNVLQATWRRCCNIARTSFKGLEEDVTTSCMEHVASVVQKMSQCIRYVFEVIWRRCYNISGISGKLLKDEVTTYQEGRAIYLQEGRCCNVSGMYCKVLDEDVAKYQEHHSRDLKKMWQRMRHTWHLTWRKVHK